MSIALGILCLILFFVDYGQKAEIRRLRDGMLEILAIYKENIEDGQYETVDNFKYCVHNGIGRAADIANAALNKKA